jgi:hypothetical protein
MLIRRFSNYAARCSVVDDINLYYWSILIYQLREQNKNLSDLIIILKKFITCRSRCEKNCSLKFTIFNLFLTIINMSSGINLCFYSLFFSNVKSVQFERNCLAHAIIEPLKSEKWSDGLKLLQLCVYILHVINNFQYLNFHFVTNTDYIRNIIFEKTNFHFYFSWRNIPLAKCMRTLVKYSGNYYVFLVIHIIFFICKSFTLHVYFYYFFHNFYSVACFHNVKIFFHFWS